MSNISKIVIGMGSCGIAAGAAKIEELLRKGLCNTEIEIDITGCIGMCFMEPIVDVYFRDGDCENKRTYIKVNEKAAGELVKLAKGEESSSGENLMTDDIKAFLTAQHRIALKNCGLINPEDIDDYIKNGGYEGLIKCLEKKTPEEVIDEVKTAGIGGRGGAGFPTWFKWNAARAAVGEKKYVICNADEGDPGAFMDRALIEGDPHALIEGMLIAAYAIGSDEGIIYVRAEYPLAIKRLEKAIKQAIEKGYLGENIRGSAFSFSLRIKAGAGAFVCGEETALIASLEGERGMPRLKPPFPAQKGFWQKPSNINNVETYANIPYIIRNGGEAFAMLGTEDSKGTKVFALTGKIRNGGLVEIPMGSTIKDVIFGVGGGIKDNGEFKAVQMGGPSGGCIPKELIDTPIDYKSISKTGAIMGSGGMVVMDGNTCMVDMARFFLEFTCRESCGKCTHCRIGTKRMLEILTRIVDGKGQPGDIELLEELGNQIKDGSLCGLGQSAPNPALTTIRYFRNEYIDHIHNGKCTALSCKAFISYGIDGDKCIGCGLCKRNCPVNAITGEAKGAHIIDDNLCINCGKCKSVCRFAAVSVADKKQLKA